MTNQTRGLTTLHITSAARQGGRTRPALPHEQERIQLSLRNSLERAPCGGGGECVCRGGCSGISRTCGVLPGDI